MDSYYDKIEEIELCSNQQQLSKSHDELCKILSALSIKNCLVIFFDSLFSNQERILKLFKHWFAHIPFKDELSPDVSIKKLFEEVLFSKVKFSINSSSVQIFEAEWLEIPITTLLNAYEILVITVLCARNVECFEKEMRNNSGQVIFSGFKYNNYIEEIIDRQNILEVFIIAVERWMCFDGDDISYTACELESLQRYMIIAITDLVAAESNSAPQLSKLRQYIIKRSKDNQNEIRKICDTIPPN